MDTYKTIEIPSEGIYKSKGSKFISFAFPVNTEEEVFANLENLRKQYYDARHHCFAYTLGKERESFRMNDDGEPSGTAGRPIYGQILSNDLTNILVVVVRYFGGTKLGTRGLIDAYKGATANAFENSNIVTKILDCCYKVSFDYAVMNDVMKVLKDNNLHQYGHHFDNRCEISFRVRNSLAEMVVTQLEKIDSVSISE